MQILIQLYLIRRQTQERVSSPTIDMASATYPTDPMHPPPYTAHDELKASGGYQQQMPPPIQPTYFGKLHAV